MHVSAATSFALVLIALMPTVRGHQGDTRPLDARSGSLARDEPQAIYSPDPQDAWNRVFYSLFTRTLEVGFPSGTQTPFSAGDGRLPLSTQTATRIESGDRATDPLYPSWLWMGSAWFDMTPTRVWQILDEPRYTQLRDALQDMALGVVRPQSSTRSEVPGQGDRQVTPPTARTPLARALMQADLWAAYDILRAPQFQSIYDENAATLKQRRDELLPLVAGLIRSLALTREEIAALPHTYRAAARAYDLPPLFERESGWMEVRWFEDRAHDRASDHRRATRIFIKPLVRLANEADEAAFLTGLSQGAGERLHTVEAAALVAQSLLIASDGVVVPSPLIFAVQIRRFPRGLMGQPAGVENRQLEISRRLALSSPRTGGLASFEETSPAYLPTSGNDFGFASLPARDGGRTPPVLVPLRDSCVPCHYSAAGRLNTFAVHVAPGVSRPVTRLRPSEDTHAHAVAARKMTRGDFHELRQLWTVPPRAVPQKN